MNKFQQISDDQTFVGIDVAKDSVAVFIDSANQESDYLNQLKDLRKLAKNLRKLNPIDPVIYDYALFGLGVALKDEI